MRVLIVADDLTGANEIAAVFATAGLSALVHLRVPTSPPIDREGDPAWSEADVVVFDTESRNLDDAGARERVRRFLHRETADPPSLVYKKIDSTLRGPIGAEVDALMERMGLQRAVVVPAFPAQGRTTVAGHQLVYGVPVQFTPAGQDLVAPARQSHLPTLLREATGRSTESVTMEVVQAGHGPLVAALEAAFERASICVIDAATEEHLDVVASALLGLDGPVLGVGTAGLARYLAHRLARRERIDEEMSGGQRTHGAVVAAPAADRSPGGRAAGEAALERPRSSDGPQAFERRETRSLVACGSRHPASRAQVGYLQAEIPTVTFTLGDLPEALLGEQVGAALRTSSVVLQAPLEPWGSGRESAQKVARAMGRVVRAAVEVARPEGLVLTGGETAHHILLALGAETVRMVDEVERGIPAGWVQGGAADGLPIVTKAGGFGASDALLLAFRHLEEAVPGPAILRDQAAGLDA
ncbi:four-carbon acid sugar kinase family protein [Limnochorda pilosa]|uniref:Four-carbon acid sugar kinase family protein n=1 Tax=Limnochorda pilosa TaxID=1555112 RepID=A0A0K2SM86_LIMPI|nr:four-carbon acid sugar kinase family protein [Limnochorda pilosa]BAS27944.1 hypothetical protein LIP_2103 [Limnochorda pilosa]